MSEKSCLSCVFARQAEGSLVCGNKKGPKERQNYTYWIYSCDLFESDSDLTIEQMKDLKYQFRDNGIYKPKPEIDEVFTER